MKISHVVINSSDYRKDDFNHTNKSIFNHRYQIDLYIKNEDYDPLDEFFEAEDEYIISTLFFTMYTRKEGKPLKIDAYNFYLQAMRDLIIFSDEKHCNDKYITKDYVDCGISHEGFVDFIDKYLHIPCYNLRTLLPKLEQAQYIFYSSLKLLSYPMDGGNTNIAFNNKSELEDFLSNPPPLI